MTYCIAIRLEEGLVFLSDSRTNAGVDAVSNFRKMAIFKKDGDRVLVLMLLEIWRSLRLSGIT